MNRSLSLFFAGLLVGALIATGAFSLILRKAGKDGGALREVTTLKLAHSLDSQHPVHLGMEHMRERLEAISGGRMTIEIYPSAVLGGETECIEQLQNGVLAMTKTSSGPMEAFIPKMRLFGLPYLFHDSEHFWKFADSETGRGLLHQGAERKLYGLCYYDAGARSFYTKDRQIKTPDDLNGLKIRVMNSPMAIKMVEMMGGSPTPISWGELYSALAQGIVDGAENNPPSFYSNKHYETCRYFSLDQHVILPDILLISLPIWEGLSSQQQEWLQQAADESSVFQRQIWAEKSALAIEAVKELGVEVYYPEKQAFMDRVAPMYDALEGTAIGELVKEIRAIP
jgi:tripartite ATP-independent transporter DctP family solute receptor